MWSVLNIIYLFIYFGWENEFFEKWVCKIKKIGFMLKI